MSKHKFTPGPWKTFLGEAEDTLHITTLDRLNRDMCEIASVDIHFNDPFGAEQTANAHLISAAPEMYEALKLLMTPDISSAARVVALFKARSALTKAEGRS